MCNRNLSCASPCAGGGLCNKQIWLGLSLWIEANYFKIGVPTPLETMEGPVKQIFLNAFTFDEYILRISIEFWIRGGIDKKEIL